MQLFSLKKNSKEDLIVILLPFCAIYGTLFLIFIIAEQNPQNIKKLSSYIVILL
jgi:hypothetical protein